jgi:hypothetical protein
MVSPSSLLPSVTALQPTLFAGVVDRGITAVEASTDTSDEPTDPGTALNPGRMTSQRTEASTGKSTTSAASSSLSRGSTTSSPTRAPLLAVLRRHRGTDTGADRP